MNIAWSGLADSEYWEYIAKYCVPSWTNLPGDKYIVHDSNKVDIDGIQVVDWEVTYNPNAPYLSLPQSRKYKERNFWRKMQSQVWALRNLRQYDWVFLLDTDVEIINFSQEELERIAAEVKSTGMVWATGESNRRGHDSGHILVDMHHPDLDKLIDYYENIWDSGLIHTLEKAYDGHAVEHMLAGPYPSVKLHNRDYGSGLHVYHTFGTAHYGSKDPKTLRAAWTGTGQDFVTNRLSEIPIKKYKSDQVQ